MNEDTSYVRMHVINYEPTYLVLNEVAQRWADDPSGPLAPYRDELRDAVEVHCEAMGLNRDHLTDEVDYAAMVEFEASDL